MDRGGGGDKQVYPLGEMSFVVYEVITALFEGSVVDAGVLSRGGGRVHANWS